MRITPEEIISGDQGDSQIGSSKLAGVHTKILAGNPSSAGFYSILLFVPAIVKRIVDQRQKSDLRLRRRKAVLAPALSLRLLLELLLHELPQGTAGLRPEPVLGPTAKPVW